MPPLYEDPWFTFRFADDRVIPRFHVEGVPAGRRVSLFKLDAATGGRLGLLARGRAGEGGWVDLPVPVAVRAGEAFAAVPEALPAEPAGTLPGPIRTVLFDLDGTLVDSRPGIVAGLRHALGRLGHALPPGEPLDWAIGPPLAEVMARLLAPLGDPRVEEAVDCYREWYGAAGVLDARPYPGVPELLVRLAAAGLALFVATAKRVDFARTVLGHFGLASFIRSVHGVGLDGRHARKAELVAHLLGSEGLDPDRAVLVGDRGQDVEAARANGLRAVGVTWGYGDRGELEDADLLCDSPGELNGLAFGDTGDAASDEVPP
jgi:phosphoglycolate phosphatase